MRCQLLSIAGMQTYGPHAQVLIADKGLERVQEWFYWRYYMKNRLDRFAKGQSPVEGAGTILTKTLLFATYPHDIKGIGVLSIRWDLPRVEDQWAYIKSVRRTRRLSGGAWMDPIGATDVLQDDITCWNGRPAWYTKIRLLGKRWILAIAHAPYDHNQAKKGTFEEFPGIDLATWPHWNPSSKTRAWEPREVYVIEGIPLRTIRTARESCIWMLQSPFCTLPNVTIRLAISGSSSITITGQRSITGSWFFSITRGVH